MPDVIDELSLEDGKLNRETIIHRVEDWKSRLSTLYDQICDWLPSSFSGERSGTIKMHEDLMKEYGVPATDVPVLNILHHGAWIAKLVPRALWIIGANGRLDLFIQDGHWILVDRAENFAPPRWEVAPADHRRKLQPFTHQFLTSVLGT